MATITLLNKGQRQGTHITASTLVPANADQITATALMNLADKQDPTNTFHLEVERSSDGGVTWLPTYGFGWTGGEYYDKVTNDLCPDPTLSFSLVDLRGQRLRATLDISKTISIGVQVEVT